jgi:hypothetical protein
VDTERRNEGTQNPESLDSVLNEPQLLALSKMESFGWTLAFVRRPLFQDVVPVLFHPDSKKLGTLDSNGSLNVRPNIRHR